MSCSVVKNMNNQEHMTSYLQQYGFQIEWIGPKSWVALYPKYRPSTFDEFETIWNLHPKEHATVKMFGKTVPIPRYQQSYGRDYAFSGNIAKSIQEPAYVADMRLNINILFADKYCFNGSLCNWYEPEHYIGPHSDDTRQLTPNSPIVSISWGCSRKFSLKKKNKTNDELQDISLILEDGDLLIMGGECQSTHKHEILKSKKIINEEKQKNRINFTFRCFKNKFN